MKWCRQKADYSIKAECSQWKIANEEAQRDPQHSTLSHANEGFGVKITFSVGFFWTMLKVLIPKLLIMKSVRDLGTPVLLSLTN